MSSVIDQITEEEEEEYEDVLVFVQFSDFENCKLLDKSTSTLIRDLDKGIPSCEIESPDMVYTFTGEYRQSVGTLHFFHKAAEEKHVGHSGCTVDMKLQNFSMKNHTAQME